MILSSFKPVFLSEFLLAGKEEGQRFFLSLLFLNNQPKVRIPKGIFWGGKTFGPLTFSLSFNNQGTVGHEKEWGSFSPLKKLFQPHNHFLLVGIQRASTFPSRSPAWCSQGDCCPVLDVWSGSPPCQGSLGVLVWPAQKTGSAGTYICFGLVVSVSYGVWFPKVCSAEKEEFVQKKRFRGHLGLKCSKLKLMI